jgi:hypothetical protein
MPSITKLNAINKIYHVIMCTIYDVDNSKVFKLVKHIAYSYTSSSDSRRWQLDVSY